MTPLIEIQNLNAGYDGRTVLRDVDLTVYDRDFLGIIGPNGGGKTTLIKCILGLLKPQSGTITFHPQRPADGQASLTIGYLPQYTAIDRKFPITVQEVILSGLSSRKGLSARFTADERAKAAQVIARMGLEGMEQKADSCNVPCWDGPSSPTPRSSSSTSQPPTWTAASKHASTSCWPKSTATAPSSS